MSSGQKFVARNRAPRVQIEYDVELYGAEKKVQLPFVMGVMSDLSGKSREKPPSVEDRKFLEIDVDNFDDRMKAMAPRAAFSVPNTLGGEGNLSVDLTFEKMDDFSPAAVARKVEPLRQLLEARTQLSNLMTYMDGKAGAEDLIGRLMADPAAFRAIAGVAADGAAAAEKTDALEALRKIALAATEVKEDSTEATLDGLRAAGAAVEEVAEDTTASALDALRDADPAQEAVETDQTADVLAGLKDVAPDEVEQKGDDVSALLHEVKAAVPDAAEEADTSSDVLAGLRDSAPEKTPEDETTGEALDSLRAAGEAVPDVPGKADDLDALLEDVKTAAPQEDGAIDLDALLAGDDASEEAPEELSPRSTEDDSDGLGDLDALLANDEDKAEADATDDLDALLVDADTDVADAAEEDTAEGDGLGDLDALLADDDDGTQDEEPTDNDNDGLGDLDSLLADKGGEDRSDATVEGDALDDLDALFADDDAEDSEADEPEDDTLDDLDALLADDDAPAGADEEAEDSALGDLEALLADDDDEAAEEDPTDDLDALLANGDESTDDADNAADDLDALLADADVDEGEGLSDLEALLDDAADEPTEEDGSGKDESDGMDDLDALLADNDGDGDPDEDDPLSDLEALLADDDDGTDDLDSLLADADGDASDDAEGGDDDLDALLTDIDGDDDDAEPEAPVEKSADPDLPFGTLTAPRSEMFDQARQKFRIALMGDFSGRASRGELEIGEGLVNRKPIKFDIDNYEDIIARFKTTLMLPIGTDGAAVAVELNNLDDLHPDQLYEKVEMFEELSSLRTRVKSGQGLDDLKDWGEQFGDLKLTSRKRAKGAAVPADRRLSDFQQLIGDMQGSLAEPSSADELIQRVVGPYVVAAPDPNQETMTAAVDEALTGAMRMVLHHPDFQAVESIWRSLELLARRVETGGGMEIVLYDVSAEEWAADLSAQEDLAESGLFKMLAEEPVLDENQGPLSAIFGLYTLEETPPHAELMARMAKIAQHINASFVTAITPSFMETPAGDRHPLVKKVWGALRDLPEAAHVGVASPRFLLRLPYGQKTEPCYEFEFEEFSMREGLKGMLWANPVILSAILMAETAARGGKNMELGSIMSLNDMPFHYLTDQHGDQVGLPCTERLLNTRTAADVVARGFMPVLSIKGRNEVRLGSFQSLGAGEIVGPWALTGGSGTPSSRMSTTVGFGSTPETEGGGDSRTKKTAGDDEAAEADDDLDLGGDDDDLGLDDLDLDLGGDDDGDDEDLDALLSGFDDDAGGDDDDDEDMDADLAALLEDL